MEGSFRDVRERVERAFVLAQKLGPSPHDPKRGGHGAEGGHHERPPPKLVDQDCGREDGGDVPKAGDEKGDERGVLEGRRRWE